MFIDRIQIFVKAGNGGNGAVSFRREKYVSHGGPDGGDGGNGGNIVFRVDPGSNTLLAFRYKRKFVAGNGGDGGGSKFHGATADDLYIPVPPGTLIKDVESGKIIHDMSENGGADFICCKGGRGGWGNKHFATPTRQIPRFAKPGFPGEKFDVILELKLLADVGLVGFPNAGKSTLLSVVSAAKPKIANYAFTTLEPNLGIVSVRDDHSFVMADIPGIIEGAHEGRGLGTRFLRHIERNSVLLFMVPADSDDIAADYEVLLGELTQYNPELLDKRRLLAITKCDMLDDELMEQMKQHLPKGIESIFISSVANMNIAKLKDMLWAALQ